MLYEVAARSPQQHCTLSAALTPQPNKWHYKAPRWIA